MPAEIQYYAIAMPGRTAATAAGLARRTFAADGPVDQTLRRDLTWQPDSAIVEWEYGDVGAELVKVGEAEAEQLIATFRARWEERA
ncbi:MAG: hypothetical protein ACLPN6_16310 [Streptosporangiaceae bacterium]|jgi:hypothetical protein